MLRSRWVRSSIVVVLIALGALIAPRERASAASWLEKGFYMTGQRYDGLVPACEAGLDMISAAFAQKEAGYWNSSLQILEFERVHEVAYRPWAAGTIPRRFCTAVALVSDGRKHAVKYWIGEDTGLIGASWGVEWCVVGLDRHWAYNPQCKMAGP